MVALIATPLMYCPRTAAGFMPVTRLMNAWMFSTSLGRVEAELADDGVDVAAGVVAELDLAGLVLLDGRGDVRA